jgi:glycosyltransferase involved in cell wall biosynthesis
VRQCSMRILFFGAYFPRPNNPTIGVWALSQLLALRDAGHEVKAVSPVPAIPRVVSRLLKRGTSAACPPQYRWDGIEVDYVRWPLYPVGPLAKSFRDRPGFWLELAWTFSAGKMHAIAKDFAPSIVFAHHGQFTGLIAAQVSRRLRVPYLITEHAFGEIESCATNIHRKRYYARITEGASAWIAVSNRMKKTMLQVFPGAPAVTVHNGGDELPAALSGVDRPAALMGRLVILSVSFFYKRKNVPLLIASFDAIAQRHPSACLVIVGSGDDEAAILAAAKGAKHASQIILCGRLSHREVLQYTAWCDIFANIAVHEPWATVFSDAMMAGKPIVFSTDCGICDVAENGVHGISVEPGSQASASAAVDILLRDSALRLRMGAAAELLAKTQLTWAANASQMTALFDDALQKRGSDTIGR